MYIPTMTTENLLNDTWSWYFHDPADTSWTLESYERLGDISSIDEFWNIHELLGHHTHQGIWFCFREHVFPCWDDPSNINGGCLSMKILKQDAKMYWEELCLRMLGETLLKHEHEDKWNRINGLSISPKKHFCIIKLWLSDDTINSRDHLCIGKDYAGDMWFRSNRENITTNNQRTVNCKTF